MSKRILVILAHPDIGQSKINRAMATAVADLPEVTVHDLYRAYPDGKIDVAREQALLREHDVIVFQHPLYWYSAPSLLRDWQDQVLVYGFAYGTGGDALHGKPFFSAISTGGPAGTYQAGGFNNFSLGELLRPFQQMANFVGMKPQPAFVFSGALSAEPADINNHARAWREHVLNLQHEAVAAAA